MPSSVQVTRRPISSFLNTHDALVRFGDVGRDKETIHSVMLDLAKIDWNNTLENKTAT